MCASVVDGSEPDAHIKENFVNSRAQAAVQQAYRSLPKHGKPAAKEGTVLAAVVLSWGSSCHVVSLATGTKCLNYKTSSDGRLAHDLHAEVLARRSACLWLYKQLEHSLQCSSSRNSAQFLDSPASEKLICCIT